ncbi:MAG: ATP-binding protein, partial [Spirochaetales bacterium]|nr:ATP-binding protein [Spirochaetales bacterium]
MVVGRKSEIKKLNELYNSDSAELVAVYGRRRVGKTYLIDETFTDRIVFRHAGLSPIDDRTVSKNGQKNRMKNQLEHFYHSLKRYGLKNGNQPKSWQEAFYLLEDFLIEKEKCTKRL